MAKLLFKLSLCKSSLSLNIQVTTVNSKDITEKKPTVTYTDLYKVVLGEIYTKYLK